MGSWVKFQEVGLLGHIESSILQFFLILLIMFIKTRLDLSTYPLAEEAPTFFPHQHCIFVFVTCANLSSMRWYLVVLIWISLIIKYAEDFFSCFDSLSSLRKFLFSSSDIFYDLDIIFYMRFYLRFYISDYDMNSGQLLSPDWCLFV